MPKDTAHQTWLMRTVRLKTLVIKETFKFLLSRDLIERIDINDGIKFRTIIKREEASIKYYNLINDFFELD